MSPFSADWLALREPADARARSRPLAVAAAAALARRPGAVRAIDLATGTGSNVRYLAGLLPATLAWLLVDADEGLLQTLPSRLPGVPVDILRTDLSQLDDPALFEGRDLVTASALLDLVSDRWVASLAEVCARVDAIVLLALSYDGRILMTPEEPEDALVRDLVNQHQRGDKGFGPALGPAAAASAAAHFIRHGYRVDRASSDWVLDSTDGELQRQLIEGWAQAAVEIDPAQADAVDHWRMTRLSHVDTGRSRLVVGHEDVLAFRE